MRTTKYFFEDLDTSFINTSLWNATSSKPTGKVIHSGYLLKHSCNADIDGGLSRRYFTLQQDHLVYSQSENSEDITSMMKLRYAKLILPDADQSNSLQTNGDWTRFTIKVVYKNKFSLLYATSEDEYDAWVAALTKVMTRIDIHERFHVEKPIGAGAFAQVYKAREKVSGVYYAVKGFNKSSVLENPSGKAALWNEIQMLRKVQGKSNVLSLHEVHETKNSVYLVMDYVEGRDLSKFISKNKKLTEDVIKTIIYGILKGLESLVEENILHRDIKPANIMLKKMTNITAEDVVIVDFGLAATSFDTDPIFKRCGTPGYIAPEVITMKSDDKPFNIPSKCDVYSTGVIMHMLCTGSSLFDKTEYDGNTILKKNLRSQVKYPSQVFGNLSEISNLILRDMLQADPAERITVGQALKLIAYRPLENDLQHQYQNRAPKISAQNIVALSFSIGSPNMQVLNTMKASEGIKGSKVAILAKKLPVLFSKQVGAINNSLKIGCKCETADSSSTHEHTLSPIKSDHYFRPAIYKSCINTTSPQPSFHNQSRFGQLTSNKSFIATGRSSMLAHLR
jgi:serine/threonine protein kinase